ncbi:MAG: hypothetical protein QOD74_2238 [Variibacter sp.]|jgi:hypothetical protein|nr:hypothetical protein [Variibacter sp.]
MFRQMDEFYKEFGLACGLSGPALTNEKGAPHAVVRDACAHQYIRG